MKNIINILILFLLVSCSNKPNDTISWEKIKEPNYDSVNIQELKTFTSSFSEIIHIVDWELSDSFIICKNSTGIPYYYVIDTDSFNIVSKFGFKGNGPTELLNPHLLCINGNLKIADNGNRNIYDILEQKKIIKSNTIKHNDIANNLKEVSFPICSYTRYFPNEITWFVKDIETGFTYDSLKFSDETKNGNAIKHDFSYDIYGNHVVMASANENCIRFYGLSDEYTIIPQIKIMSSFHSNSINYTDVFCTQDYVYLLSQRHVNIETYEGGSIIEQYNYSGELIKIMKLNIIATKMLLDINKRRIFLLSATDDDIHIAIL